ncbi:microsomal glutathione S-transferase 1 isoform X2 [Panthera pardus]|uniref:Microsomal glutathione S-transferase 1 isoform X2 n=1 Tax=Panthera pardus TaxID=9691 RepID=A0A9W2UX37_PANPR|nr:microsomal glutathione S-transferase 1 isoform X2 [Panthera pardus]XP_058599548.1 microsomal glutathione S-transferase 1 isoform X2 [Neofelis nebulosa]
MVDLTELMENEVFMAFASYTTIILSKMMFMSTATAFFRLTRKVFANPEDCVGFGKGENAKKYLRTDDKVERVRRIYHHKLPSSNCFCFSHKFWCFLFYLHLSQDIFFISLDFFFNPLVV